MKNLILNLLIAFALLGCNNGEREIIIVPKNFKGYILVIFNQKSGSPESYHNGSRIYKIPQNGIFKTKFSGNYGWRKPPEFYYEEITKDHKLLSYLEEKKMPTNKIIALMGSNGNANKDYAGNETVEFAFFYIGTKSEIEELKRETQRIDIVKLAE